MGIKRQNTIASALGRIARTHKIALDKKDFQAIRDDLVNAKRFSFADDWKNAVTQTYAIGTEELLDKLPSIPLPFDKLWIEGPDPSHALDGNYDSAKITAGWLVKKLPDGDGFSFTAHYDMPEFTKHKLESLRKSGKPVPPNENVVTVPITTVIVNNKDGIVFNDDSVTRIMENIQKTGNAYTDSAYLVDQLHDAADFLLRSFALMSSRKICPDMNFERTAADLIMERKDRSCIRLNVPPRLEVTPIVFDASRLNGRLFRPDHAPSVRDLLGLTSVRAHVVHRNGKEFVRRAHERRIASNVDRRNADRVLVNTNDDLRVALQDSKPVRKLEKSPTL